MSNAKPELASAAKIAARFNDLFTGPYNVRMSGGAAEPEYQPACRDAPAQIRYRSDFPHSALHEAAHWCIAGPQRRTLSDYGYWYQPPPRGRQAQQAFARVEAKVQGLEAIFAQAVALPFRVSIDDVDNLLNFEAEFSEVVEVERRCWRARGLPARAKAFEAALIDLACEGVNLG
jgi:elongation factor P hydroxylase